MAAQELFSLIDVKDYEVWISIYCLYEDNIIDLIDAKDSLTTSHPIANTLLNLNVKDLSECSLKNSLSINGYLERSDSLKRVKASEVQDSEFEHKCHTITLLRLYNTKNKRLVSQVQFIELAGSEQRINKIADNFTNLSLYLLKHSLGEVFEIKDQLQSYLKMSMIPESPVLFVCCVAPDKEYFEANTDALKFASRIRLCIQSAISKSPVITHTTDICQVRNSEQDNCIKIVDQDISHMYNKGLSKDKFSVKSEYKDIPMRNKELVVDTGNGYRDSNSYKKSNEPVYKSRYGEQPRYSLTVEEPKSCRSYLKTKDFSSDSYRPRSRLYQSEYKKSLEEINFEEKLNKVKQEIDRCENNELVRNYKESTISNYNNKDDIPFSTNARRIVEKYYPTKALMQENKDNDLHEDEIKNKLEEMEAKSNTIVNSLKTLLNKPSSQPVKHDGYVIELEERVKGIEKIVSHLQRELEDKDRELKEYVDSTQEEIRKKDKEIQSKLKAINELKKNVEVMKVENRNLKEENIKLPTEIASLKEIEALNEKRAQSLMNEIADLNKELKAKKKERSKDESAIRDMNKEMAELKQKLVESTKYKEEYNELVSHSEAQKRIFEETKAELERTRTKKVMFMVY